MITTVLQTIFDLVFLILPGPLVIDLLYRSRQHAPTSGFLEKLLLGFVLWSLVLTMPIVLLSLIGFDFRFYYFISAVLVFVITCLWLVASPKRLVSSFYSFVKKASVVLHDVSYYHLLVLLIFLLMVSIYHPTLLEWDTVTDYLPSARSIASTGGLYNIYRMSNYSFLNGFSVQITYSYFFYFNALDGLRLLPFVYFLMTAIAVYQFAKESKTVINPILPVCILATFPVTWKILAEKSLYLEIPFVFYTTSSLLLCYEASKEANYSNYLFLGASLFNLMLSKELGFFMASLFVAIVAAETFCKSSTFSKVFYASIFTSMFNVLFLIDILGGNDTVAVGRQALVLMFSLAITLISVGILKFSRSSQNASSESISSKISRFCALIPFMLLILFFTLKNFLNLGSFTYSTGPAYGLFAEFIGPVNVWQGWNSVFNMFSAYRLLTSSGLISIYLAFFILGLAVIIKRRHNLGSSFLGAAFLFVTLTWATITLSASSGDDFRRLYYFVPLASIIITMGTEAVFKKYKNRMRDLFVFMNSILILMLVLVFYQGDYLNALFWRYDIYEDFSLISLLIGAAAIFSFVALPTALKKTHIWARIQSRHVASVLVALQIILAALLLPPIITYAHQNGYDPANYYQIQDGGVAYNISEVVNYLNQLNNSYAMISIFGHYIPFYTNRTSIELTGYEGYLTLKNIMSEDGYLEKLEQDKIKYILEPRQGFPDRIMNLKKLYRSSFPNYERLILQDAIPTKIFQYFTLHEIMYQDEIHKIVDYNSEGRYLVSNSEAWSQILNKTGSTLIGGYTFAPTDNSLSSFAFKIRAKAIDFGIAPWDTYRLIFGYQNYTRFFDLYLDKNGIIVLTETSGDRLTLVELPTNLDPYQWHDWSILYRDGKLIVIVDDTYEIVHDQPISITGKVGFLEEAGSLSEVSQLLLSTYNASAE